MPVLIVYGIPNDEEQDKLELFSEMLISYFCSMEEFQLKKDQVSCFFPTDRMNKGLGEEIIIFVEGLFRKKERTEEVRRQLADMLCGVAKTSFPRARTECFVKPYDERLGFSSFPEE